MKPLLRKCPKCGSIITALTKRCSGCGSMIRFLTDDHTDRCGNCHKFIGSDEYCRSCGTKRGEGAFDPYYNEPVCVYGPPPVERKHSCSACGFEWTTCMMIDDQRYCPRCGSGCSVTEADELH